jgi:hypothetical protein
MMIDPQMQANKWIKNIEKMNDLKTIKASENPGARVAECLALVRIGDLSLIVFRVNQSSSKIVMKHSMLPLILC